MSISKTDESMSNVYHCRYDQVSRCRHLIYLENIIKNVCNFIGAYILCLSRQAK